MFLCALSQIASSKSNGSSNILKALEHQLCLRHLHSVVSEQRPQPRLHHQLVSHLPNQRWRNQQDSAALVSLQRQRLDSDWAVLSATQLKHPLRQVRVIEIYFVCIQILNFDLFCSGSSIRRIWHGFGVRLDKYGHDVGIFIQYTGIRCDHNIRAVCVRWLRFK